MATKLYPKHHVSRDVYDLACERLAKCFKRFDTILVWFSGGKDSTACLNLAVEVGRALGKPPVRVAFFDEEAIPPDTVDYAARVRDSMPVDFGWYCLPILHRNACSSRSPWWYPWAEEDRARWVRELPAGAIIEADVPSFQRVLMEKTTGMICPPTFGQVCSVLGIRTQESLNRFQAIANSKTGHDAFFAGDHWRHVTRAYPIYDWAHEDVWFAPEKFGWDYNRAYDLMQKAGIPLHHQRCAPPFGEQPLERLWTYHVCWPQLWDKMTSRVPGAATAGRYARTSLYGYGESDTAMKPESVSWKDFVQLKLSEFPVADRAVCAKGMRKLLDDHAMKTKDPLPETEPHRDSGLCWMMIAKLVLRGDLKGRKVIAMRASANARLRKGRERQRNERSHDVSGSA